MCIRNMYTVLLRILIHFPSISDGLHYTKAQAPMIDIMDTKRRSLISR